MFKLAGNVIVFGVVSAYVVGIIRYVFEKMFSFMSMQKELLQDRKKKKARLAI
ncbi:hypothetical protein CGLO_13865 [Colletotrichum gloeosporioides Cg-14]|uniref:Uncharacterized protein n=1 Tax=Colletotrichum gloeosporioides (strain Cg-14) TaxID=1237896 RepID=T0JVK8_COLGC|nr:hypothetical protein CGLO_13865 [Colletotrichum gloeosporioides Cg-14]